VRIVHITPTLEVESGGLSEAVRQIAFHQAERGHEVTVITPKGKEGGFQKQASVGVAALPVLWNGWGPPRGVEALLTSLHPEQLHFHGLWEPFLHVLARWGIRNGVRTGWTPHGMEAPLQRTHYRFLKLLFRYLHRYPYSWEHADWVQVLNEEEQHYWADRYNEHVVRIPNGTVYRPPEDPMPEWLTPLQSKRILVFLGRLHPEKGADIAVGAFLRIADTFPDTVLVLAGSDGGMAETLRQRIQRHSATDRVVFPGWVGAKAKAHLLSRATLYVHPSQSEGHSLALLDAACYGVPVLMSKTAGFPELVEAGGAVVFEEGEESCAQHLGDLLGDPAVLSRIGERGQQLVRSSFSWESTVSALLQVYGA